MIHLHVSAGSQMGCVRDHNEDMILIDTETYRDAYTTRTFNLGEEQPCIVAVCDGLGGHAAGEIASQDAAQELGNHVATLSHILSPGELHADLESWSQEEHLYLLQQGLEHPEQRGMGTTLVAVLVYRNRFYLINCGDSRCYLSSADMLRQLSTDHSLFNISNDLKDRHTLTNCLGASADSYIDFTDITPCITSGSRLLLCSDGLSDMCPDSLLQQLLSQRADAPTLIASAYEAGGLDNVSAIIVDVIIDENS